MEVKPLDVRIIKSERRKRMVGAKIVGQELRIYLRGVQKYLCNEGERQI